MRVDVIQADIEKGRPCDSTACAIAQALLRQYPNHFTPGNLVVRLTEAHIKVSKDSVSKSVPRFKLPPEAVAFAVAFDLDRYDVEPITFEMTPIAEESHAR